jgi:hypothetical protein
MDWEWKEDDGLRTRQLCQAMESHPVTGEMVWFNQAHLFHISAREPGGARGAGGGLRHREPAAQHLFADGSTIGDDFAEVRAALDAETVSFPWEQGDVLMLDNMLVAHARSPFKGPRKVIVAMAEPRNLDRF